MYKPRILLLSAFLHLNGHKAETGEEANDLVAGNPSTWTIKEKFLLQIIILKEMDAMSFIMRNIFINNYQKQCVAKR